MSFSTKILFCLLVCFVNSTNLFSFPQVECKDRWKNLIPKGEHLFDVTNDNYQDFSKRIDRENCYKNWSVFIYLNADNDLTQYALADIFEMESVGSSLSVDTVIQLDTRNNSGLKRFHIAKGVAQFTNIYDDNDKIQFLSEDDIKSPLVEKLPESDSGNIQVFDSFLDWAFQKYPSRHYMVVLWSHGEGFDYREIDGNAGQLIKPSFLTESDLPLNSSIIKKIKSKKGGISFDEKSGNHLSINQIKNSLKNIEDFYNFGNKIDIYGSDACLMQEIEVAYELREVADYIIGSAETVDYFGWPWRTILTQLVAHPLDCCYSTDIKGKGVNPDNPKNSGNIILKDIKGAHLLAIKIPELYRSSFNSGNQGKNGTATMATITFNSSSILPEYNIITQIDNFGYFLNKYISEDSSNTRLIEVKFLIENTLSYSGLSKDIYYFTLLINMALAKDPNQSWIAMELRKSAIGLQNALNYSILNYSIGYKYYLDTLYGATRGLAIWIPESKNDYDSNIEKFSKSEIYRECPNWKKFIDSLYPKPFWLE